MGMRMPETCWAVFKRQVISLRSCCIWLVDSVESMMMHGLANPKSGNFYFYNLVFALYGCEIWWSFYRGQNTGRRCLRIRYKGEHFEQIRRKWKEPGVNDVSVVPKSIPIAETWSFPLCKALHLPDTFPSQAQVTSSATLYSDTLSLCYTLNTQQRCTCFQIASWYVKLMSLYPHDQASHKDNQKLLQFVCDC
jgi:hypothetical protein